MKLSYLLAFVVIGIVLVSGCAQQGANAGKPASTSGEQASEQLHAQQTPQSERELEMQERSAQQSAAQESQKETVPASSTSTPGVTIKDSTGNKNLKITSASCGRNSDGTSYIRGSVQNIGATDATYVTICFDFRNSGKTIDSGWTYADSIPGTVQTQNTKYAVKAGETKPFETRGKVAGWDSCVVYSCS